jgi:hypothetical protein
MQQVKIYLHLEHLTATMLESVLFFPRSWPSDESAFMIICFAPLT